MADEPKVPEMTREERQRLRDKFGWKPGDVQIKPPPPKPLKPVKE